MLYLHLPVAIIKKGLLYCGILCLILAAPRVVKAQTSYKVDQIPNPQVQGRTNVSDPDQILQGAETDSLNALAAKLKKNTGVELGVAIVNDFDQDQDVFGFATSLFRKWGIGGAHSNNGLLLFVAVNRKEYRFITGYGLEGNLPDGVLSTVGRRYLAPAFQQQAYGEGMIKALSVIDAYLNQPNNKKDLNALLAKDNIKPYTPWYQPIGIMVLLLAIYILLSRHMRSLVPVLSKKESAASTNWYEKIFNYLIVGTILIGFIGIFIIGFTIGFSWLKAIRFIDVPVIWYVLLAVAFSLKYLYALATIRKSHKDDFRYNQASYAFQKSVWWYVLFSPLVLLMLITESIKRSSDKRRLLPQFDAQGNPLSRLDRDDNPEGTPYLSAGQQAEEKDGVYSYDIWVGSTAQTFKVIANEGCNYSNFDKCPKCGFKTLAHPVTETIIRPTYTSEGKGKKVAHCTFCKHEQLIEMVVLPKRSSSSDSSSSSGSSSSSSSSSSGSFGGGSTGGGGAGGTW